MKNKTLSITATLVTVLILGACSNTNIPDIFSEKSISMEAVELNESGDILEYLNKNYPNGPDATLSTQGYWLNHNQYKSCKRLWFQAWFAYCFHAAWSGYDNLEGVGRQDGDFDVTFFAWNSKAYWDVRTYTLDHNHNWAWNPWSDRSTVIGMRPVHKERWVDYYLDKK